MGNLISRFYRCNPSRGTEKIGLAEHCFYVESSKLLTKREMKILMFLFAGESFGDEYISSDSFISNLSPANVIEIGPRLNFATAWNTNALSILRSLGIGHVTRIEMSRRYTVLAHELPRNSFLRVDHDRMTEQWYEKPLESFETGIVPEAVYEVPLAEKGPDALKDVPGVAMDEHDRQMYYEYFVNKCGRNPTIVEIMDLNNANSEHSRHGYFKGRQVIDGTEMPETLMQIVSMPLQKNRTNSALAFCDNSSVIWGSIIKTIVPKEPGKLSAFREVSVCYDILFTAETHNFPSGVAPFPGAETGTGGRIRDVQATGRGGLVVAGTAAYCVGNLQIPGYKLPWENETFIYPKTLASPLKIEIDASDGASDYGNKFGEPVIQGFTRSFGLRLPSGERKEWLKPIMFTGGIGQVSDCHLKKGDAKKGMLIIQIGGPAYRVGFGGGAASSLLQGEQEEELDFDAVQRGDAEMEQKMNRVIRSCIEKEDKNPIVSIHDQGAGGPGNVLKELVEKSGGTVDVRKIKVGDPTMSVLEIWVAEYQERNGLLIYKRHLKMFERICEREKVNFEVLGEVTGDGVFTLYDSKNSSIPVWIHLDDLLGNMPQKKFHDEREKHDSLLPLKLPQDITMEDALDRVLRNVAVGSKRFLTNKVDRSVTGLIAQQQCVGRLQLPLSNVAVVAQSHFDLTGAAIAIGERPLFGIIDPAAQGRMTVAEMLTNIVWARITDLTDIKCSANWMWAPKLPGEGAKLYDAAVAVRDLMVSLGIAIDGGKDSLSMATKVKESGETVKSPGQLVLSGYCLMGDINRVVTPDIKKQGSYLIFIDLAGGKRRLGGSILAQCYGQVGHECPDLDNPELLEKAFLVIQDLIERKLILSGHDVSDGGLIVTLLEMAFAGNCGFNVDCREKDPFDWFAEEAGLVIECDLEDTNEVQRVLKENGIPNKLIGKTNDSKFLQISGRDNFLFKGNLYDLRSAWEETSYQLERLQCDPDCAEEEKKRIHWQLGQDYHFTFLPKETSERAMTRVRKPKVAIIREEGSNGDREMASAFHFTGFEPWDVTMTDIADEKVSLDMFRGAAFVGGFSYADVFESAKGWAAAIRFNAKLRKQFNRFYKRPDTFSLGVCNGCQLEGLIGWVPQKGLPLERQPRFVHNLSRRFESRWSLVKILSSPSIMLSGMGGSVLGVWVAHGEGRIYFPDKRILEMVEKKGLAPIRFVDEDHEPTEAYPFNPNGSKSGITALCDTSGRHLAMMPHPERTFLTWQWAWLPDGWDLYRVSPWIKMFQNAREWCEKNK